jgi:hypothetical protein
VVTQADSYPNHKFRFETWVVTQADSSPIRLRFETWVVTQADSYPNHKFRFETWVVTQADSSPIRLRFETWVVTQADSYPSHNFRFETWVVTQAKSPATCLDSGFPNCQICLKLRFETSFKFRFPKSSQNYFIAGLTRVPSLNKAVPRPNP